jgi:hypothetical protein
MLPVVSKLNATSMPVLSAECTKLLRIACFSFSFRAGASGAGAGAGVECDEWEELLEEDLGPE